MSPTLREFRLRAALAAMFALADEIDFAFVLDPTINRAPRRFHDRAPDQEELSLMATQTISPADGRILIDATGATLDSFRRELMDALREWDGHDASVHAALGTLVVSLDDANEALVGSQIGVSFDEPADPREFNR